jgi:predicted phage terminase large subunit-like protein
MLASHTASLSMDFGRDLRNAINSPEYQAAFPGVSLAQDARAAYRWNTSQGGQFFAVGKTGAAAGRGGNLVIIDDPHSEQDIASNSKAEFEKTWKWFLSGPRQRLQPGAAIVVVMTRWGVTDLTGMLHRWAIEESGEQWELIQLPAILPSGKALFPEFWPLEEIQKTKAILPPSRWAANYQQEPTSEEGAIIKREWWRNWDSDYIPVIDYRVMSWDCAMSEKDGASRSACVVWGKFMHWDRSVDPPRLTDGIILLDRWAARVDFPRLKAKVRELYEQHNPDCLLIEKKASGGPLIDELWRSGIYAQETNPSRSQDKVMRTNSIADMFACGLIWAPLHLRWALDVVEEMAAFPNGEYDDLHDAAVWGLMRLRRGNLIRLNGDPGEDDDWQPRGRRQYY